MRAQLVSERKLGNSIIEMPFVIWILILGFALPLIVLATIGMRYNFLLNAAREAATAAALAKTFEQDVAPPTDLSAKNRGINTARHCCQAFSGVMLTATPEVWIVGTPITAGPMTPPVQQQNKLTQVADGEKYVYEVEVDLKANINPLVTMPSTSLGINIPGLTAPFPVVVRSRANFENLQGLHY